MRTAGTTAALPSSFNTWCCGWRAIRVDGPKHVCPKCGLIVWDGPALIRQVFGPDVVRLITTARRFNPVVDDWEIERMLDA